MTTMAIDKKVLKSSIEREQNELARSAEREKIKGLKNLNVPHLRFPEFSGEWKMATFGDIAKGFDYGMNAAAKSFDGNNKYIRITDIDEVSSQYLYDDVVSPDGELEDRYLVKENDILLARTGASTGKSYLYRNSDGKLYFAGFLIRANIYKHNSYFVFSQLHTLRYKKWISVMSARSGQPGINSQEYASFPVYTTSLQEEDKIATFLKLLDERIITQNKIIEDLKKLKSAISESLFKDIKGDIVMLSEICEITKGKQINGEFLSEKGKYYVMNGGTEPSGYYNIYNVEANTISISEGGNSCGYVQFNTSPFWSGGHCYTIQKIADNVDNLYLYHFLKSKEDAIMKLRIGSGLPNIQKKDLAIFKIKIPTVEQQKAISTFLSSLEKKAEIEERIQNAMLKEKLYLLQQMFI
jgi:type I restriction endonuclease S subunit